MTTIIAYAILASMGGNLIIWLTGLDYEVADHD